METHGLDPEEPVDAMEPVELEEPFEPDGALKYGQIKVKLNKKKENPRNIYWFSTWARSWSSAASQLHARDETMWEYSRLGCWDGGSVLVNWHVANRSYRWLSTSLVTDGAHLGAVCDGDPGLSSSSVSLSALLELGWCWAVSLVGSNCLGDPNGWVVVSASRMSYSAGRVTCDIAVDDAWRSGQDGSHNVRREIHSECFEMNDWRCNECEKRWFILTGW